MDINVNSIRSNNDTLLIGSKIKVFMDKKQRLCYTFS